VMDIARSFMKKIYGKNWELWKCGPGAGSVWVLVRRAHSALNCGVFLHLAVTFVDWHSLLSPDEVGWIPQVRCGSWSLWASSFA
jgi:hypothetical protein